MCRPYSACWMLRGEFKRLHNKQFLRTRRNNWHYSGMLVVGSPGGAVKCQEACHYSDASFQQSIDNIVVFLFVNVFTFDSEFGLGIRTVEKVAFEVATWWSHVLILAGKILSYFFGGLISSNGAQ